MGHLTCSLCHARARTHARLALEAVADDLRVEGAAEALWSAAYEAAVTHSCHDAAECAGPVEGEVGRQDAIDAWLTICEEPDEWIRDFAERYSHEAPSDQYVREQQAEALREAADALDVYDADAEIPEGGWTRYIGYYGESSWLRARAKQIEEGP